MNRHAADGGTVHLVRLQFVEGGPAVTGEWVDGSTARRTWRDWVGLYGSDERVVIRLAQRTGEGERVLMAWEAGRVVKEPTSEEHTPLLP